MTENVIQKMTIHTYEYNDLQPTLKNQKRWKHTKM